MKKTIFKYIVIIFLLAITFISCINIELDASYQSIDTSFLLDDAEDKSGAGESILKTMQAIMTVIQVVAVGSAVILLIVLAIKYMTSAPGGKVDIRKTAVAYIVGVVILFSISGILQIIKAFSVKNINE